MELTFSNIEIISFLFSSKRSLKIFQYLSPFEQDLSNYETIHYRYRTPRVGHLINRPGGQDLRRWPHTDEGCVETDDKETVERTGPYSEGIQARNSSRCSQIARWEHRRHCNGASSELIDNDWRLCVSSWSCDSHGQLPDSRFLL